MDFQRGVYSHGDFESNEVALFCRSIVLWELIFRASIFYIQMVSNSNQIVSIAIFMKCLNR